MSLGNIVVTGSVTSVVIAIKTSDIETKLFLTLLSWQNLSAANLKDHTGHE